MIIKVFGDPVPKGSMKCVGRGNRHQLVDTKQRRLEEWMGRIEAAARDALHRRDGFPYLGALDVTATFTVLRPPSVPYKQREWPISRSSGDIDKLARGCLDALTRSTLINDDSQVVHLDTWSAYPDTEACPGRLDRPGISIRIEEISPSIPAPPNLFGA